MLDDANIILENDAIVLWQQNTSDDVAILTFKTKMNSASREVLDSIVEAVAVAEHDYAGLVIHQQPGTVFCVGADLRQFVQFVSDDNIAALDSMIVAFQKASLALRYACVPTVAAVKGLALGGGCELMLHCTRTVADAASKIGLVETAVGLLPAGGGCKDFLLRACDASEKRSQDFSTVLTDYFLQIASAFRSRDAHDALEHGFLKETDSIVDDENDLLSVAKNQVRLLVGSHYVSPEQKNIPAPGRAMKAVLEKVIQQQKIDNAWSDHDVYLARHIANIMCGGDVESGTPLPEQHYLDLERVAFVECAQQEKSLARMEHILTTGKPLKN